MKKSYYFLLFLLIWAISLHVNGQLSLPMVLADQEKYTKEIESILQSAYTSRRDYKYTIDEGKVTINKFKDRLVKFQADGKPKELVFYDKAGREKAIVVFEYVSSGLPGAETEFHPTGELLKRTEYKYKNGILIEKRVIDQYGYVVTQTLYKHEMDQNRLIERIYGAPQMVTKKIIRTYSNIKNGQLISYEEFDGESIFKYKRELFYENNLLIKEEYTNPARKKAFSLEYSYDSNSNVSKIEKVLLNGTRLLNAQYNYNSFNLLLGKIEYDRYGKINSYYKYSYD